MPAHAADPADPLALVHQGWEHLRLQRPLAAWASWQQALRAAPGDPAATQALDRLAGSTVLPQVARVPHRFYTPDSVDRRARWDRELRGGQTDTVAGALRAFSRLVSLDPDDAAAWYNLGLCRAWNGENVLALGALHRFVVATAATDLDAAADAWMLAEVLRHGAGAEEHADDLSWTVEITWDDPPPLPQQWLDAWPHRALAPVVDPVDSSSRPMRVFELLNPDHDPPRVNATLVVGPGWLRFSSLWRGPDRPWSEALEANRGWLGLEGREIGETRAHVLPLHLLDSQAWTFRLPEGIDPEQRSVRTGEALTEYYTGDWIHQPRHGLALGEPDPDEMSPPWLVSDRIQAGDPVATAQLEGVVRLREQLARRPQAAPLYDHFSFDTLRAHLRLPLRWSDEPEEPNRDVAAE